MDTRLAKYKIISITKHMPAIVSKNYLFTNINVQQAGWKVKVKHIQDYYYLYDRLKSNNITINHSYLYFWHWTLGETPNSVEPPERRCGSQDSALCNDNTCFSCNSIREANSQTVRGTLLVKIYFWMQKDERPYIILRFIFL